MTQADTANVLPLTAASVPSSPDTATAKPKPRGTGKRFAPGYDPRRNLAGRPRKGETLLEVTAQVLDKRRRGRPTLRQEAAIAWAETMAKDDAVSQRARADWVAYESGLPKQAYVVETQVPGWLALTRELAALGAIPLPVIEGQVRELSPAGASEQA